MVGQSVYGRCASGISGQLGHNSGISTDKFTLNIFDKLNLLSMIALYGEGEFKHFHWSFTKSSPLPGVTLQGMANNDRCISIKTSHIQLF